MRERGVLPVPPVPPLPPPPPLTSLHLLPFCAIICAHLLGAELGKPARRARGARERAGFAGRRPRRGVAGLFNIRAHLSGVAEVAEAEPAQHFAQASRVQVQQPQRGLGGAFHERQVPQRRSRVSSVCLERPTAAVLPHRGAPLCCAAGRRRRRTRLHTSKSPLMVLLRCAALWKRAERIFKLAGRHGELMSAANQWKHTFDACLSALWSQQAPTCTHRTAAADTPLDNPAASTCAAASQPPTLASLALACNMSYIQAHTR